MSINVNPPPRDPWAKGVRASDVPVATDAARNLPEAAAKLSPNRADISAHLYALFSPAFVQPYPDSWIEIAYGKPDGKPNAAETFPAFDIEKATDFAERKNKAGYNIYVGAALRHGKRSESGRADIHHVLDASHAWAEFEGAGEAERIDAVLKAHNLAPAMVITTGTTPYLRQHLYFKLDGAVRIGKLEAGNTALCNLLGSDSVQDAPRIMRLAGTVNYPSPKKRGERGYVTELTALRAIPSPRAYRIDELVGLNPAPGKTGSDLFLDHGPTRKTDEEIEKLLKDAQIKNWRNNMIRVVASMVGREWDDFQIKMACAPYCDIGASDPDLKKLIDDQRKDFDKPNPEHATSDRVTSNDVAPIDLWARFSPPSLGRGILPDVIENYAIAQGRTTGADLSGIAVAALAVCAAAIPDSIQLQVKQYNTGWRESARIWVAIIGGPSVKKTPIIKGAVYPLEKIDAEYSKANSEARAEYNKLSANEKKKTQPPTFPRTVLQSVTIEAAQEIFKDNPGGLLIHNDELAGFFGSMDKYSGGKGSATDRAFWLQSYNGGVYTSDRVGRGSTFIPNLSACILGGIQPDVIRGIAGDCLDDGLLQRFLPIVVQDSVVGLDEEMSDDVFKYGALIRNLHSLSDDVTLKFDEGAQRLRLELEHKHKELETCWSMHKKLATHIGKYDGIFARLCVLFHCIDNASGWIGGSAEGNPRGHRRARG